MILLQYSHIGNMVKKRHWFFHAWRLKPAEILHLGLGLDGCYPPRCVVAMDHEKIVGPWAVRILGIDISVMPIREE